MSHVEYDPSKMNPNIAQWYEKNTDRVRSLMHDIWCHPELGLKEYYACEATRRFAEEEGFTTIETHAAEDFHNSEAKPNTMIASWGSGKPVIAFVGELDALPDLGQEAVPYRSAVEGPGHACGHCLMAGGAAAAAAALRYAMEKEGVPGTVKLIEAPAEEIGKGKGLLALNGVFDGIDAALMWHPAYRPLNFNAGKPITIYDVEFEFHGKSAHACGQPWKGRSALDAVQLMNMGCEFLREHVSKGSYIHYCITNGGAAANIVPDYAAVKYMFRNTDSIEAAADLLARGIKCAEGAAHMTDTTMTYTIKSMIPRFNVNDALNKYMYEASQHVPKLEYEEEDYALAAELYRNLFGKEPPVDQPEELIDTTITPYDGKIDERIGYSTDAADMSYICPSIHCMGLARLHDSPGHHWNVVVTSGTAIGEKGAVYCYKILAQGAWELLHNPGAIEEIHACQEAQHIPPYTEAIRPLLEAQKRGK